MHSDKMSSSSDLVWLTEEDVRAVVDLNDAVDALAQCLVLEPRGEAINMDKALGTWASSSIHALGSIMPKRGFAGFKTWANTPKGASAVFSVFDANDGRLVAMIEAAAIGTLRTAAVSGLATRQLADPGADELAIVGTGFQSMMQVAAIAATRRLHRLRVFSPTAEHRCAFALNARKTFGFEVVESPTLAAAVRDAPIITLMTRAREPFLAADMVSSGAHINAVGAILPANAEFAQDIFDRATLVAVDNIANTRKASREFTEQYGQDDVKWKAVKTLGQLLDSKQSRPPGADITLFKPMGMGLSDLAVAMLAYERAMSAGIGRTLLRGVRALPRWEAVSAPVG